MNVIDFSRPALPRPHADPLPAAAPAGGLDAAAEQFEAMFLRQMLKQMRKAGDVLAADNSLRSAQTDTVRELHDNALADSLARRRQTGIADLLVKQLTPASVAPPVQAASLPTSQLLADRVFGPIIEGWNNSPRHRTVSLASLVERVIVHESAGDVAAVSSKGALGLMQLMPATAREMAASLKLPYDEQRLTSDADYNRRLGTAYLDRLLRRYDGEQALAVAAYNAGPARVDQWLQRNGDPRLGEVSVAGWVEAIPFAETRDYTRKVLDDLPITPGAPSGHWLKPTPGAVALLPVSGTDYEETRA